MRHDILRAAAVVVSLAAAPLAAQASAPRTAEQMHASYVAHQGDFDYLLGEWEFTGTNQQYGRIRGYWSAGKLAVDGQIVDEYRVVGDTGETYYASTTVRAYNAAQDRWELVTLDGGSGLRDEGTAHREGAEMRVEQTFGAVSPEPSLWRIRYHDIGPDRFLWSADRSTDGGRTWQTNYQQLEAHRIGPPRTLGPMAPARNRPAH